MPYALWADVSNTVVARNAFRVRVPEIVSIAVLLMSVAILVFAIATGRLAYDDPQILLFGLFIVAGLVANAAICGIMSKPHHRYEARLIWLLPTFVLMAELRASRRLASDSPQSAGAAG